MQSTGGRHFKGDEEVSSPKKGEENKHSGEATDQGDGGDQGDGEVTP
jgi:hypothetical protein